ncbi:hypothetical protein U9M48_035256 [Paspalum notatum var. saurae]|uniref:Uncharacterized protein n=1 Tax=Paspalum notatum var. saurae TaxID=547442 RepID=A0AAQ3X8U5_PASNO
MAKEKYGLIFHPNRQDNIVYRAYFPEYSTQPNSRRPPIPLKDRPLDELDLMNSVGNLCRFTMHEQESINVQEI